MDDFGLTTVTFRSKTRQEVMQIAKNNGLSYVEWGGDVHVPPMDNIAVNDAIRLQNEFGIPCLSYGSYYRLLKNSIEDFDDILLTASKLGAKIIRIWMGYKSSKDTSQAEFENMVAQTKNIADKAKKHNIIVAFEFHNNTYNDSYQSSLRFLKAVDKSNVKTYWQPFTNRNDFDNLKQIMPYLVTVHVFAWSKKGVRFPLMFMKQRWKKYIRIIDNANFKPYWIMEFVRNDSEKQFIKDVKCFKSL